MWDFGDGSSSSDANPTHKYAPDVDAMVKEGVGAGGISILAFLNDRKERYHV